MRALLPVFIITTLILSACSSGKKAFEQGDYYKSVITSVDRLRSKPNHKKAGETLRNAYPLAVKYYVNRADNALASNSQNKWKTVVDSYTTINSMFEQISRSPGALRVIPDPVNYYDQLETAKNNAANEAYQEAEIAFGKGTREGAREAVGLFRQAQYFVPNYKDTNQRIEDALWAATLKVVVEPIPIAANSLEISADFFQNKITEYLHSQQVNEFVRFFTPEEAVSMNLGVPDQVIELSFDQFSVGDVYFKEREVQAINDSVVVATYYTDAPASASSLSAGGAAAVGAASSGNSSGSSGNVNTTTPQKTNTDRQAVGTQRTYDYSKQTTTPPTTSGGQTTPPTASGGQTTPPTASGGQTTPPPASGGQTTPPPASGGQTTPPPASGGQTTPPPGDSGKVTICHKTGNGYKTITINKNALQAHLKHGDLMGECPVGDDDPQTPIDTKKPPASQVDPEANENTMVDICYISGNKRKTIKVKMSELQKYLDQGATLGNCLAEPNQGGDRKSGEKSNKNGNKNNGKKGNNLDLSVVASEYGQHGGSGDHMTIITAVKRDTVPPGKIENKVYASVKATVYEFSKTLTSRGVLDFRIIDPNSGKVLTQEKLPGEYIWVSEWATFNGDARALDERQKRLVKLREAPAPGPQDLFIEFTAPIYQQIIGKINNYYRGY